MAGLTDVREVAEVSVVVKVLSGGQVLAHVMRIDNQTGDAVFVPGQRLP
jgi:hypothetical protein